MTDLATVLSKVRASAISPQAFSLLAIVDSSTNPRNPELFIGEVECFYRTTVARNRSKYPKGVRGWTYNSIATMLRKLAAQGYLDKTRGRYVSYSVSKKGAKLLESVETHKPELRLVN